MIASAIQRTTRMRFGNYVNALSFHHPLRLAAEAAMLDNLAQGRFDFGVGRGVRQGEFAKLGLNYDDAVAMTEEAIDILRKVWTQDSFSYEGRFWRFPELSLRPSVYQQPHPPLHEVASRPASVARVGARGWPVALQGFCHLSSLAATPPPSTYSDERFKQLTGRVWGGRSYDELAAIGGMLIGAPEQVAAQVEQLEAIGVDTLLLVCSFGNLAHVQVCRSLELFAQAMIRPRQTVATAASR